MVFCGRNSSKSMGNLQGLKHYTYYTCSKDSFLLLCEDDLWLHQGRLSRLFEQKAPAANAWIREIRPRGSCFKVAARNQVRFHDFMRCRVLCKSLIEFASYCIIFHHFIFGQSILLWPIGDGEHSLSLP